MFFILSKIRRTIKQLFTHNPGKCNMIPFFKAFSIYV